MREFLYFEPKVGVIMRKAMTYMMLGALSTVVLSKSYQDANTGKVEKTVKDVLRSNEKAMRWLRNKV